MFNDGFAFERIKFVQYYAPTKTFYAVINRFASKLGVYVIKMKEDDPLNFKYLMSWGQALEISDVQIDIYRNEDRDRDEMVFCHKSMNINTVNVFMLDLSKEKCPILTRHESF